MSAEGRAVTMLVAATAFSRCARMGAEVVRYQDLFELGSPRTVELVTLGGILHVGGAFAAAALAYFASARVAAVSGALVLAAGIGCLPARLPVASMMLVPLGEGAFAVGLLAHAALLLSGDGAGDGAARTPRRFAAMSAFVLAREAFGAMASISAGLVARIFGYERVALYAYALVSMLVALVLVAAAAPAPKRATSAPALPPYRAPSPIATDSPRPATDATHLLGPLVLPALLFAACGSLLGRGGSVFGSGLLEMLAAAGGAVYFIRAAQLRLPAAPLRLYGLGLTVLGAAGAAALLGDRLEPLAVLDAAIACGASVAAGIGTAYAGLAVRGRASAVPLACWTAGAVAASYAVHVFNHSVHSMIATMLGISAIAVGVRFTRTATAHQARFE